MAKKRQAANATGDSVADDFMARVRALEAEARGASLSWSDVGPELVSSALDRAASHGTAIMLSTTDWSYRLGVYPRGRGKGVTFTYGDSDEAAAGLRKVFAIDG